MDCPRSRSEVNRTARRIEERYLHGIGCGYESECHNSLHVSRGKSSTLSPNAAPVTVMADVTAPVTVAKLAGSMVAVTTKRLVMSD